MRFNVDSLFIKISGITSEEDALFAIGLGASAVGFDFGVTPRQISPQNAQEIVRRLPQGALSIGSFRNEMPQRVVEISNTIGLSAVQLEGAVSAEQVSYVSSRVNTVLRLTSPEGGLSAAGVDYFVVPDNDDAFALNASLEHFRESSTRHPVIASGGLDASNVSEIVLNFPVFGVDARSGVERSPGVKDPALLGAFIANAKWAAENSHVARNFNEWQL